jgi:magnesium-transporting ATPase (P-type)
MTPAHRIEPDSDEQNSSNEVSKPDEPLCEPRIYWGIGILAVVLIPGITFFAVGLSRLNSAKSSFPNIEFASPPSTVIAFHWLNMFGFAGFGILVLITPYISEDCCCWSTTAWLIVSIVFYICYLIFFFVSPEFIATVNSWNLTAYELITQQMIENGPYVSFKGWASKSGRNCTLNRSRNVSASAIDASVIPNITQGIEVKGETGVYNQLGISSKRND